MLPMKRALNQQNARLGVQEAKQLGPTLGEFYGQWQGLPGLRGLWYPGSLDETGAMYDQSNQGRTLTYAGNPYLTLYNDLVPWMRYDGTGDWHTRPSEAGLQISGAETYIASAQRGLTFGGIWRFNSLPVVDQAFISKYNATGNQRQYMLLSTTGLVFQLVVSSNGTATTIVTATDTNVVDTWYFVVGRFTPSTELLLRVNDVEYVNTTSIPASLYAAGTSAFRIGSRGDSGITFDGGCALAFLAAAVWPDSLLNNLYNRSRPLFGI